MSVWGISETRQVAGLWRIIVDERFKDDAGRRYSIEQPRQKDGLWYGSIYWITHESNPARVVHTPCLLPDGYESEQAAYDACEHFARNQRPV